MVLWDQQDHRDINMNIHEYQAKALLRSYGAPVSDGRIVLKSEDAKTAAGELDGPIWVVKAQIHAVPQLFAVKMLHTAFLYKKAVRLLL